ncbi:MAG: hypothetical protein M1824_000232 [Vezdaea acicularis]|nr:MAG: hypothetical protein M1824_000232 [Vezdaea acicularis]
MSQILKVVALISGGKDSLFSILHCLANGHTVVAMGNLYSNEAAGLSDDIDSYMYQTVGQAIIPLYEEALGIPLYRQEIIGTTVDSGKTYGLPGQNADEATQADETESLIPLLRKVLESHPQVNAVSTGAILSDYQRTRVESVAIRLGLTPLSYLWQYPFLPPGMQDSLLKDMAVIGQDSRIIKVASGGLDESFLWQNVASTRTRELLARAMRPYGGDEGGAILGEGGEFETLSINGPPPVWKKYIDIEEQERQVVRRDGGVVSVKVMGGRAITKTDMPLGAHSLRIPDELDVEFSRMANLPERNSKVLNDTTSYSLQRLRRPLSPLPKSTHIHGPGPSLCQNLVCTTRLVPYDPHSGSIVSPGGQVVPTDHGVQMDAVARNFKARLDENVLKVEDVVFVTILLRSMEHFSAINRAYGEIFQKPNPPARITVACGDVMPPDIHIMMSAVVSTLPQRESLHVQSRSYWAPANIGPYSQAASIPLFGPESEDTPYVVYVAGQIPLAPASMRPISSDFYMRVVLSLQHLWRIGQAMKVQWWLEGIAFITGENRVEVEGKAKLAWRLWSWRCRYPYDEEEAESIDPWDRKYGGATQKPAHMQDRRIPDPALDKGEADIFRHLPFLAVEVEALPRETDIEWAAIGIKKIADVSLYSLPNLTGNHYQVQTTHQPKTEKSLFYSWAVIPDHGESDEVLRQKLRKLLEGRESAWYREGDHDAPAVLESTLYIVSSLDYSTVLQDYPAKVVPCKSIWSSKGESCVAGLFWGSVLGAGQVVDLKEEGSEEGEDVGGGDTGVDI